MSKKHKKKLYGFTFIELIIAITIIAILSVLGFMSYSSHLSSSRDSIRKSELSDIYSMLDAYKIKDPLPIPDKKIEIYSSGILLGFQGYISNSILSNIGFKGTGKDPLDNVFYTYYLTKDFRNEGLLGFLEDENKDESYLNSKGVSIISQANAVDYSGRVPIIIGKKLGILLDGNNNPIQENPSLQAAGKIELSSLTSNYIVYFDDKTSISNSDYSMDVIYGTSVTGIIGNSCDQYIDENNGEFMRSGYYLINSSTGITEVYCNMETTTGSGVQKRIATCSGILPSSSYATNGNTYLQTYDGTNWLPIINWGESQTLGCDFNCNTGYNWNGVSCGQIINGVCGFPNGYRAPSIPSGPLICLAGTPTLVSGSGPWNWSCNGLNTGSPAVCSTLTINTCMAGGFGVGCIAP